MQHFMDIVRNQQTKGCEIVTVGLGAPIPCRRKKRTDTIPTSKSTNKFGNETINFEKGKKPLLIWIQLKLCTWFWLWHWWWQWWLYCYWLRATYRTWHCTFSWFDSSEYWLTSQLSNQWAPEHMLPVPSQYLPAYPKTKTKTMRMISNPSEQHILYWQMEGDWVDCYQCDTQNFQVNNFYQFFSLKY